MATSSKDKNATPESGTAAAGNAERQEGSTSSSKRVEPLTEASSTDQSNASAVREVSQQQPDRVAIVSRTSMGEAHQSPGYEVISVPEDADEKLRAAAENRPEKGV